MQDQPLPRFYTDFANLWPLVSPPEDYTTEAHSLRKIIQDHLGKSPKNKPHHILEFGAGGGHTLCHFTSDYHVTAVDLAQPMLDCCKKLIPTAEIHQGDMRNINLEKTFDVILCHDAIDYILTPDDIQKVFQNARRHLKPAGLFIVAPTYTRETFLNGEFAADQNADENIELTFTSYIHDPDTADDTFEMILIYIIRKNGKVTIEQDRHICSLFTEVQWVQWLSDANFQVDAYGEVNQIDGCEEEDAPCRLFVATKKK